MGSNPIQDTNFNSIVMRVLLFSLIVFLSGCAKETTKMFYPNNERYHKGICVKEYKVEHLYEYFGSSRPFDVIAHVELAIVPDYKTHFGVDSFYVFFVDSNIRGTILSTNLSESQYGCVTKILSYTE